MSELILFSGSRSGCSARIRIAANLKGLPLIIKDVNLAAKEHLSPAYVRQNPNSSVPTLVVKSEDDTQTFSITQSLPALEYLEEAFPERRKLLGNNIRERAKVRELAALVACDIQPPQNLRVRNEIEALGGNPNEYAAKMSKRGFAAYEKLLESDRARQEIYSVGSDVSLADVCLIPMVQRAMDHGLDFQDFPLVKAVYVHCQSLEGF